MTEQKNTLYLECTSGISGDMIVASLLDLGADEQKLRKVLEGIHSDAFQIAVSRVKKAGVDCCDFDVIMDEAHDGHDHDMSYLYGHLDEAHGHHHEEHAHHHDEAHGHHDDEHAHHHDDEHAHHHDEAHGHHDEAHDHHHGDHEHHHHDHHHDEHDHDHHHHSHHHVHVGSGEVAQIIDSLDMTEGARALAHRVFDILARAEAKAHAVPLSEVHFHEVGAIDSIVDIVAGAVCFDDLGIGDVVIREICEGTGTVRCQHGILPVPVPAVANIAADCGLPMKITERSGELVTPTGAAFAAAIMTANHLPETFRIKKVGLGAGKRAYEIPSVVRAMLIEPLNEGQTECEENAQNAKDVESTETTETTGVAENKVNTENIAGEALHTLTVESNSADVIWKLECDVDDCTGEQLGYAMERLYELGAREVHYLPLVMKKSRPGWELVVLCDEERLDVMESAIFAETTTIGIRRMKMERTVLARNFQTVTTEFGQIDVKVIGEGSQRRIHPEYESVAAAAKSAGVPMWKVYRAAEECE